MKLVIYHQSPCQFLSSLILMHSTKFSVSKPIDLRTSTQMEDLRFAEAIQQLIIFTRLR